MAFAVGSPFRLRVPQYPDHTFPLDDTRPPWVTHVSSPPCRPQTPWCDEEEPYAFALVVRARPFPVFGRPVHPWARALRLRPGGSPQTLQTPPRGGRPALQKIHDVGSRSAYLSPGFRRRASLASPYLSSLLADEALPPSLDIDPGPRVEWDFNPPETCAARRTLRTTPPLCSALVLWSSWGFHLDVSLNIGATGSHVPHKSLNQGHAASMPDAIWAVSRYLPDLSRVNETPPVLTSSMRFSTRHQRFACARPP